MESANIQAETKKELFAALEKLSNEINSFRRDLNKINDEKELWFSKKEDLSRNIKKNIESIKENRAKRDALTKSVKGLKEKRTQLNEEIRKKISELVELKNELNSLMKKSKIKNPNTIKGEIDSIEVKLETEVMSFEKEKELSKKLKLLKKLLGDASVIISLLDKIRKLNLETNALRKNSNEIHNEIQKLANESQELHEGIIKSSKEIEDLEAKEEEAFKNFVNSKKNFNDINSKLKEKLKEMSEVREKINKFKLEEEEKRKLKEGMLIQSKEQEIEEKIKTGKKLTTDDFLVFQEIIKNKREL